MAATAIDTVRASLKTVTLTITQRIGLEGFLGEQKGKRENNAVFYRIRKKIRVTREQREQLTKVQGNLLLIDETLAESVAPLNVELEAEEVRQLRKLIDGTEINVAMMDWLEPIMEQLEEPATRL